MKRPAPVREPGQHRDGPHRCVFCRKGFSTYQTRKTHEIDRCPFNGHRGRALHNDPTVSERAAEGTGSWME